MLQALHQYLVVPRFSAW